LKTIWMEELKIPRLSPTHCFFNDLGGDSILATSVLERIRAELNINLPYFILFRYRTLDKLTEYIRTSGNKIVSIETLQLPENEQSPVIIFIPPIKGGAGTYNFSAKSFPEDYGLFSLTYNIVDDENRNFYPLNKIMNAAAEMISQYGFNTIALFGYSLGGLLAFEIASRLQKEKANKLILIDIPPAKKMRWNLVRLILNDFSVIARNIKVKNYKTLKTDFDHIGLCLFYLFSRGDKMRKMEKKSHLYLSEAAHLRFYRQFNHGTYNGDMLLIRSTDSQFKLYSFGWDKFIKGTIEEHRIKSSHFHILENEKIDEISELVINFIEK
jgi:thioesterase domain-containing protein